METKKIIGQVTTSLGGIAWLKNISGKAKRMVTGRLISILVKSVW